jgi:hypothetical protein
MDGNFYNFVNHYKAAIEAQAKENARKISKGNLKSFEDYKKECGKSEGMQDALIIFNDALREFFDEDDINDA